MSIQDSVLIVRLNQSKWSPWGYDREAAKDVASKEGSKEEDTHVTKRKISKKAIQKIVDIMSKAYNFHVTNTMPSGTEGDRLITVDMYAKYTETMDVFGVKMNEALDEFVLEYPQWVAEARSRLQGLFKDEDYPAPSEIRSRFSQTYRFLPLPSAEHISVKLLNGQLSKVRASVEEELKKVQKTAMKSLWDRTYDAVAHMAEILGNSEARLHSTLIGNMKTLCDVLKSLNFTNDSELESLRLRIETKLTGQDPEELRKSRNIRLEVAQEAKAIVAEISEKRKLRID